MIKASADALVLGAGPGALAIAAALSSENLKVEVLANSDPHEPWPYTYGIWGEEVDDLGLAHLLEHRWKDTVSFFGEGADNPNSKSNIPTPHNRDYGLFDKNKLQHHWLSQCELAKVQWHKGLAQKLDINDTDSRVTTEGGKTITARLVVDATGYDPVFLKSNESGPVAVQTCYGIVAKFNKAPIAENQFILMDYRCDHLSEKEKSEPPNAALE